MGHAYRVSADGPAEARAGRAGGYPVPSPPSGRVVTRGARCVTYGRHCPAVRGGGGPRVRGRPSPRWPCAPAGRRCCLPRGKSLVASRLGSRVRPKPCRAHLFGSSGGVVWVAASAKTPIRQRRHSHGFCLPDHARGGHRGGTAGAPWWLGHSCHLTQLASQQCTPMPQNGFERPFSPICVHSCLPTVARATGRGHGFHDFDGPMAPVMPGCSDLRLRRWGSDTTSYQHELTKPLFLVCCRRRRAIWTRRSRAPRSSRR